MHGSMIVVTYEIVMLPSIVHRYFFELKYNGEKMINAKLAFASAFSLFFSVIASLPSIGAGILLDEASHSEARTELSLNFSDMCKVELPSKVFVPKDMCLPSYAISYRNCYPNYPSLPNDTPRKGVNTEKESKQCAFMSNLISGDYLDEMIGTIEKHDPNCAGNQCQSSCDMDCDNLYVSELYESYLLKFALQSRELSSEILRIYRKVFHKFGAKDLNVAYEHWVNEEPLFPVSQKSRDWMQYKKEVALRDIIGVSHDPTSILLGGDFLKVLQYGLSDEFRAERDYMFNSILKKARGYRTNSKKGREGLTEAQIGITSFDLGDLEMRSDFYENKKWLHPGRSQCDTSPVQGMYQNEAVSRFIPLKCGISGSTNFWIWTALYSGVNLTPDEVRLFLLSAYIVLGADGGHSLMEVLSSAAMSAIYMKHYETYSKDLTLLPFIRGSNFAKNLYEVTKDINPIGNGEFMCIDFDAVANDIYSHGKYRMFNDTRNPDSVEIGHRKEIEAFFLRENARFIRRFGDYTTFLDKIPELNKIRRKVGKKLKQYVQNYCMPD